MPTIISDLEVLLGERRVQAPPESYTGRLFADRELIQRKVMEEAFEVCLEIGRPEMDEDRVASEAADLLFHLLVALVDSGVTFERVLDVLAERRR